tara:strand:- start:466 stop:1071 length:606 start_codon:yes stop_codon:yes gene_type:complete
MPIGWGVLRNYSEHAREMGAEAPKSPMFFIMPPSSLTQVNGIHHIIHPGPSILLHHEVEFVIQIGHDGTPYRCGVGLDLTNRTAQRLAKSEGLPWTDAKGFPMSGPHSNLIPFELTEYEIKLEINGEIRQHGKISDMVHNVGELFKAIHSRFVPESGDIIFTGSPQGVGPLFPGDRLVASLWQNDVCATYFEAEVLASENY